MHEQATKEMGVVKVFYTFKGYGFITRPKGRDVFFHFDDILTKGRDSVVVEGDKVSFYIEVRDNKTRAVAVQKIG